LLAVLNSLETSSIPGLEAETWIGLPPEQQDLALSVARRALEARGLAQTDEKGQMLVHRALLTAVGVCAYPQRSTLVEHWSTGAASTQLYAHTRGDDSVLHTVDGGVHTFVLLASEAALADHLASACQWDGAPATTPMELTIPRQDFTRVCDASADGAEADALQVLNSATGPSAAGSALVHALASGPRISVVQLLRDDAGPAGGEQSFTVIEGGNQAWLVSPVADGADAPLRARTVSRGEITTLLQGR
jgi:hypothetical protein